MVGQRWRGASVRGAIRNRRSLRQMGDCIMKKFIVMAAAASALVVGGAASAQDLGSVISGIFGYPANRGDVPAVVAGTQPYGSTVYVDQYGRQVYVDQYGRRVLAQPN